MNLLDGMLTTLWARYSGLMSVKRTKAKSTSAASDLQSAQAMMNLTLTKLLDDGAGSDPSHEEQDLSKSWQVETTALFLQQGMRVAETKVPSFWSPALRFWLQSELSSNQRSKKNAETSLPQITLATRRSWAQILLVCARNMALLTSFRTKLKQDATLAKDMARFILTCVASVGGSDSDRLRSAAWSTTASLFCSRVFGNGSL
jgi:hypothetical protein